MNDGDTEMGSEDEWIEERGGNASKNEAWIYL
jgi:hypothetical protein